MYNKIKFSIIFPYINQLENQHKITKKKRHPENDTKKKQKISSFARVDNALFHARVARDIAAPFELTPAIYRFTHHPSVIASIAAQKITPILPLRGGIAFPSLGAERAHFIIFDAKIRGVFRVDEVRFVRRLNGRSFRHEPLPVVASYDFGGTVEFILQSVAHFAKGGHFQPASFQRARA